VNITDYQAKYLAYELTKRCASDSAEKLAAAVAGAQVELNPHQVDAALFAFQSPFSKGCILADEVGLGKTIEAGLVISQKWAERKRRILIITPANLRMQWYQELNEKFFLPCEILESKSYNAAIKKGHFRPFETQEDVIVICSYQFAVTKAGDVAHTAWDLVVIDEAHRLRNVYKPTNKTANILKMALRERHKLLLTATPLQNSLLELFGLVSVIDEHTFGDLRSFRDQFVNLDQAQVFDALKARLRPICHRTLRRQVMAYVPFTERHAIVEPFDPGESEEVLDHLVSDYLQRDNLQALPPSQRTLMTLVLRKLLASSSFAIAGALTSMANRLRTRLKADDESARRNLDDIAPPLASVLNEDYEALDETADEWEDEEDSEAESLTIEDRKAMQAEIVDLEEFTKLALSIDHNAKGRALITALKTAFAKETAFAKAAKLEPAEKAIIFTESRKTQNYLLRLLADSPYADGIVLFNGTNTDDSSKAIYARWLERHKGNDKKITGSRTADMRRALVDYFREEGRIMIATEAGAEGINLQFCSLVVNYDMPWNPQRIEQRIGRCHRYGQLRDVVVVNFLNRKNAADERVYELLDKKFKLFKGVFGSSDEVLGAIESGVDFEMRIAGIYQKCRRPEDVKIAFDALRDELKLEIDESMKNTRRKLLENFDDEVRDKLKIRDDASKESLSRFERHLMELTEHELRECAAFTSDSSFVLRSSPVEGAPTGLYELPRRSGDAHLYRLGGPLAEHVITQAKGRCLPAAEIEFHYADHGGKISILEPLCGQSGTLIVSLFTLTAMDQAEEHFIHAACTDAGTLLDEEQARRLLALPATVLGQSPALPATETLFSFIGKRQADLQGLISKRNDRFYQMEAAKIDGWADDLKAGLEREIKELDRQIREARRVATGGLTLEEKLAGQKQVKVLEAQRSQRRRSLFDAQDQVDSRRDELISLIEGKLKQNHSIQELFAIRWRVT